MGSIKNRARGHIRTTITTYVCNRSQAWMDSISLQSIRPKSFKYRRYRTIIQKSNIGGRCVDLKTEYIKPISFIAEYEVEK